MLVVATIALFLALIGLAVVDIRELRLPNDLTLPLIAAGLGLSLYREGTHGLALSSLGALIGVGVLWLLADFYERRTGRRGLGLGDAKLFGAAGAWLGPTTLPSLLFVASSAGLAWAVVSGRFTRLAAIPFGPFLCIAFFLFWCGSIQSELWP